MNYLLEIKAFYDLLEVNQLPTPSIVLWHALMHIANKTGWQDTFTVASVVLQIKTGLNKQAILRARNILKENGYIDFYKRGNSATRYTVKSLVRYENHTANDTTDDTTNDTSNDTTDDTTNDTTGDTTNDTINKQNKTKRNNNKTPLPPANIFEGFNFTPELQAKVEQWFLYKTEKRQAYKPQGAKSFLAKISKKAEEFGESKIIELIDTSMANNWQGIFYDKLDTAQNQKPVQNQTKQKNRFINFEQRDDWDFDELERQEHEYIKRKLEGDK